MASINVTYEHWKELCERLLGRLEKITGSDRTITDEATFRDSFIDLPAHQHGGDPDQNYGNFIRHHEEMVFFIQEIDRTISLSTPNALSDVFFTAAFFAVQSLFEEGYDYSEFSDIVEELNEKIRFNQNELPRYGRNVKVQVCLQAIFDAYIQCYLKIIEQARVETEDDVIDIGPIGTQIDESSAIITKKLKEWEKRREEAEREPPQQSTGTEGLWEKIRELGRGTFGVVDLVKETSTGTLYARKSIPKKSPNFDSTTIEQRVQNEVAIMMKLRHNHIAMVNILLQTEKTFDIIMQPTADCDLKVFLEERCVKAQYPHETMRLIDPWFGCLISALSFAHAQSIKHEDIKPTNVLIKGRTVFLTDFGTAKDFSELEASTADSLYVQGSPAYWAPEKRPWGRPADVWALGCVFAEMLTVRTRIDLKEFRKYRAAGSDRDFRLAFSSNPEMVKKWLKEKIHKPNSRDKVVSTLVEQICNMLIVDHDQRPEARRVRGQLRSEYEDRLFCTTCAS